MKIVSSVVDPRELSKKVQNFLGLSRKPKVIFHNRGLHDVYRVGSGKPNFLKVYRPSLTDHKMVLLELELVEALKKLGMPVSTAIKGKNGRNHFSFKAPEGARTCVLFKACKGLDRPQPTVRTLRSHGVLMGKLHSVLKDIEIPYNRITWDVENLVFNKIHRFYSKDFFSNEEISFYKGAEDFFRKWNEKGAFKCLEKGICHGDLHLGNVTRDSDGKLSLFDFDLSGHGYLGFDLAVFKYSMVKYVGEAYEPKWKPFLVGYRSTNDLSKIDIAAIDTLVFMRAIWADSVWTSALHELSDAAFRATKAKRMKDMKIFFKMAKKSVQVIDKFV